MSTIGLCEDDPAIRRVLTRTLQQAGHDVLAAHSGSEALSVLGTDSGVSAIVMDIGLPDADGRDVCLALKSAGQSAPVLFLTALGGQQERLAGFGAGGDDYVEKPFDVRELVARIEVLVRRGKPPVIGEAGLTLDPASHSARAAGGEVLLTPTEFRMLAAIASRPDEVVRRRSVIAAAWPDGAHVSDNTVDSFVRRIRRKLESIRSEVAIETVRGVGFRLR